QATSRTVHRTCAKRRAAASSGLPPSFSIAERALFFPFISFLPMAASSCQKKWRTIFRRDSPFSPHTETAFAQPSVQKIRIGNGMSSLSVRDLHADIDLFPVQRKVRLCDGLSRPGRCPVAVSSHGLQENLIRRRTFH